MRLRSLTVQHFRNVPLATLTLRGRQQFLVGANGQGKTNLLEAVGFLTALRSFRTTENRHLIAHGEAQAGIAAAWEHERLGETRVTVQIRRDGKEVWCDQERVTRLADFLGRFPTVVFSSQDQQLVRGAPALRRRWLDLTLAAVDADYLKTLQLYTRALAERNALLRSGRAGGAELAAFEAQLAPAAAELVTRRRSGVAWLAPALAAAYQRLADTPEPVGLEYAPSLAAESAAEIAARLESGRARDQQFRSTLAGPHRDELEFTLKGVPAREFASEGQQRSFVLALRLAQEAWFRERTGVRPVLLADDVLGELDPQRRSRFWAAIAPESQVLATGTELPAAELGAWQVFEVRDGQFQERAS